MSTKYPKSDTPFSRHLRSQMDKRAVGTVALATAVGVSRVTIRDYRDGRYLPRTKVAYRIAEALDSSRLYWLVTQARAATCAYCGGEIIKMGGGGSEAKWCSTTCRDRARHGRTPRVSAESGAIGVMCRRCEPEGACFDGGCPLRAFSPLPLVGDRFVPLARVGSSRRPVPA